MGSVLDAVALICCWRAFSNAMCNTQDVNYWARLVGVMCDAFRNKSAKPDVATSA